MIENADSHAAQLADRITRAVENIVRPLHAALEKELASVVKELAADRAEAEQALSQRLAETEARGAAALERAQREAAAEKEAALEAALATARAAHDAALHDAKQAAAAERDAALSMAQASAQAALSIAVAEAVSGTESKAAAALAEARSDAERTLIECLAEAEARSAAAFEHAQREAAAGKEAAVRDAVAAAEAAHEAALSGAQRAVAAARDEAVQAAQASAEAAQSIAVAEAVSEAESKAAAELAGARADAERTLIERLAEAEARSASALERAREAAAAEQEAAVTHAVAAAQAAHEAALNDAMQAAAAAHDRALNAAQASAEATLSIAVSEAVSAARSQAASELAAVRAEVERTLIERVAEAEARSAGAAVTSVTDALARERLADMASALRLLDTVRAMDQARSMGEVLDALAGHAPVESGRVAVFLVREGKLSGWRFRGFPDITGEPHSVELRLDESDVIARAVTGHACAATSDRDVETGALSPAPPGSLLALPSGRAGFAAPVCVGGQVVAVVYADEGGVDMPPVPSPWPEILELVARHASRCLELLMVARVAPWTRPPASGAAQAEPSGLRTVAGAQSGEDADAARRYARLLISEIKLYHESDVNAGKRDRDLLKRLKPEIDRARRLYEERIPPAVRARTDCFDQELVRTLADGNAGLLGQAT